MDAISPDLVALAAHARFARQVTVSDRVDDFFEISVGGNTAQVFRPLINGVRAQNFRVKGALPGGKQFYRGTGFSTKGMAREASLKLWRAALEGRFDALEGTKLRKAQPVATVGMVIAAFRKNIGTFKVTLEARSVAGYVNALRQVVARVHGATSLSQAGNRLLVDAQKVDGLSAGVLTEELLELYLAAHIGTAGRDVLERNRRIHGAVSAIRNARALFDATAMKCYRGLVLPDLEKFMGMPLPPLPDLANEPLTGAVMLEVAAAARRLKAEEPVLYLVHLLARHCGLRPVEIVNARVEWIERRAGGVMVGELGRPVVAVVNVCTRSYFKPKAGSAGEVGISPCVWGELEPMLRGRAGDEMLVLPAGSATGRWELINLRHNEFMRPWTEKMRARQYELRRWGHDKVLSLTGSWEVADRFLRHKPQTLGARHYNATRPPLPPPITLADCGV